MSACGILVLGPGIEPMNLALEAEVLTTGPPEIPMIFFKLYLFVLMRIFQVTRPPERAKDSFVLLKHVVRTWISKLWPVGQMWPVACFCHTWPTDCSYMVHELRMTLTFLRIC